MPSPRRTAPHIADPSSNDHTNDHPNCPDSDSNRPPNSPFVRAAPVPNKGMGVIATQALTAGTYVGTYPGRLYTLDSYAARLDSGRTTSKFAVDFYKPGASGKARDGYVLDPGNGQGEIKQKYAGFVAPLVNEPGPRELPNLVWVWNLPSHTLEFWTSRHVAAGAELLACYGTEGEYPREYCTSCVSRRRSVEQPLHVILRPWASPVPYHRVGAEGVRRAILWARSAALTSV